MVMMILVFLLSQKKNTIKLLPTAEEYKARLQQVEKLVLPFFTKLLKTADKEYIYWPNRKSTVEAQIQKILALTRND